MNVSTAANAAPSVPPTGSPAALSAGVSAASLRVWLVHDWLNGMRGGEKVLLELVRLFPQARIATLFYVPGATHPEIESRIACTSFLQHLPQINRTYRHLLPLLPAAIRTMRLTPCDLVISTSHCVAKGIGVPRHAPHLCYCFTPMRYLWDMQDQYVAKHSLQALAMRAVSGPLRRIDQRMNRSVTQFACTCRNVARRIERCYGRPAEVVYPGIDTSFYRPAETGGPKDFYLIVSALVPYKRVDLAVKAFAQVPMRCRRLVVIGKGPEQRRLQELAAGADNIAFLSWQSDEQVRWHYQHAQAFLFPGEEDFGLTPLEAQACGRPVIAYGQGGALETMTAETGLFFHDPTVEALTAAIHEYESKRSCFVPATLHQHAAAFSWEAFRRGILHLTESLVSSRHAAPC